MTYYRLNCDAHMDHDATYDEREEERTEAARAYPEPDWRPDDRDLAELFPDTPPRRH